MNSSSGTSERPADFRRDSEHARQRRAGLERALAGALDHGSIGDRVGKRHAQLDQVRAAAHQRFHQRGRAVRRGIARRQVGDQALAVVFLRSSNSAPMRVIAGSSSLKFSR